MNELDIMTGGPGGRGPNPRRALRRLMQGITTAGLVVVVGAGAALAATVTLTPDRQTVNHPGGVVTYTVEVACEDPVGDCTLDSLSDSLLGDLDGVGTCEATGQTFDAANPYTCEFSRFAGGPIGATPSRTVTAMGLDATDALFGTAGRTGSASVTVTGTTLSGLEELIKAFVDGQIRRAFDEAHAITGFEAFDGSSGTTPTFISRAELRSAIRQSRLR